MASTHSTSRLDVEDPDLLGKVSHLAVIGFALGLSAALLLGGCSGVRPVTVAPREAPEPSLATSDSGTAPQEPGLVQVSTTYLASEWTEAGTERLTGRSMAGGALMGLLYGGGAGAQLSVVCGPLFIVCAVFTVPAGAAVGTVIGTLVGVAKAPSRPTTEQRRATLPEEPLRQVLAAALAREGRDPELVATIEQAAEAIVAWTASPGDLAPRVRVTAVAIALTGLDGPYHPARLDFSLAGSREGDPSTGLRVVEVRGSEPLPAQRWLEDGAALLRTAVQTGAEHAGRELGQALLPPSVVPAEVPTPMAIASPE